MTDFTIIDSGKRQEFETGARRDIQEDKVRYDLLPLLALKRWATHMANGAKKYGERNWEKGIPISRYYASAFRHLMQWAEGCTKEDHLSAVLFNIGGIIATKQWVDEGKLPKSLDDYKFGPDSPSLNDVLNDNNLSKK